MKWIKEPVESLVKNNSKSVEQYGQCGVHCIIDWCSTRYPEPCKTKAYPMSK